MPSNEPPIRPLDVRLVPAASAGWAATVVGIVGGSMWSIVLAAGWALAAAVFVASRSMCGRWSVGLIGMAVVGSCYAGASAVHAWALENSPVVAAAHERAWVSARIVIQEDPKRVQFAGPETVVVRAEVDRIDIAGIPHRLGGRLSVLAPADGWDHLVPGQHVAVRGRLALPERSDLTLAVLRAQGPPLAEEEPGASATAASAVRTSLADAASGALPPDRAALLPGLVVGDVSRLPEDLVSDFKAAGLAHLTAVSGANFAIVLGAVLLSTRALGIGPVPTALICAVVLICFVVVARPSPSVLRAAVMGGIGLLSLVTGRRRQAVPALCTAVLGLLIWWPELAVDFGFALSVAATAGLVVLAPVFVDWLRRRGWPRALAEMCAVAVAAHAVTAPIVAGMSGTFSAVGTVANVAVAPMIAPITVVGVGAAVLAPWAGGLASLLLHLASAPLWWLIGVAHWAASVPAGAVETPRGPVGAAVVVVGTIAAAAALRYRPARMFAAAAAAALIGLWIASIV